MKIVLTPKFPLLLYSNKGERFLVFVERRGQICPAIFLFSGTPTLNWKKKQFIEMLVWQLSNKHKLSWKSVRTIFQWWFFFNPGIKIFFFFFFSLVKPGSQSANSRLSSWFGTQLGTPQSLIEHLKTSQDSLYNKNSHDLIICQIVIYCA